MKKLLLLAFLLAVKISSLAQVSLVKEFNINGVQRFETLDNKILFNDASNGNLWSSDGTGLGTFVISNTSSFNENSARRCRIGNHIFYASGSTLSELYKSDGTISGTVLIKGGLFPCDNFANLNGILIFTCRTTTGTELWRSDGTEIGTYQIVDLAGSADGVTAAIMKTAIYNGYLYFSGPQENINLSINNVNQNILYPTVWKTDGTAIGTARVANSGFEPLGFNVVNNKLIYTSYYPYSQNICITAPNLNLVRVPMVINNNDVSILKETPLIQVSICGNSYQRPWAETFSSTNSFVSTGNVLFFYGVDNYTLFNGTPGSSANLWRSDGTTTGTYKVTNFDVNSPNSGIEGAFWQNVTSSSNSYFNYNNIFYCPINSIGNGIEIWRSDGLTNSSMLRDINTGSNGSNPKEFRSVNGFTYFFADDGDNNMRLWKTDGTLMNTVVVDPNGVGLNVGSSVISASNDGRYGISMGGKYYFSGRYNEINGLYVACSSSIPSLSASTSNPICAGTTVTISATSCSGTINWSTGATTSSIVVSPIINTTYTATCVEGSCSSSTASIEVIINTTISPTPIASIISCLPEPTKVWEKKLGGNNFENLDKVLELSDGSLLWIGFSSSPISGDKTIANFGGDDGWIVKTDATGNTKLWEKVYGGSGGDYPAESVATPDGGAIICFASTSGISGDKNTAHYGAGDVWVIKINASGTITNQWTFGGGASDSPRDIIQTSDGNYLLSIFSYSSGGSGNKNASTSQNYGSGDVWLVKLDPTSTNPTAGAIWQKTYGGSLIDNPATLIEASNGDILVATTSNSNNDGNKTATNKDGSNGTSDFWVLRISSTGALIWDKTYGGAKTGSDPANQNYGNEVVSSIIKSNTAGRYIVAGYSKSQASTGNKTTALRGTSNDGWIVEFNELDGAKTTEKTIGGANEDLLANIIQKPNNLGYWVAMTVTGTNSGDITDTPLGLQDFWISEIPNDFSQGPIWNKRYGSTFDEVLKNHAVRLTSNGDILLGGYQATNNSNTETVRDYYGIKLSQCSSSTSLVKCNNSGVFINATGCPGEILWSNGLTGSNIPISTSDMLTARCTSNALSCPSPQSNTITISLIPNSLSLTGSATNGLVKSTESITSSQIIGSGSNVAYEAGNSISLNGTFQAQTGSVFKAEIKGCN